MDIFRLVVTVVGTLAALLTVFLSWKTVRAARETIQLERTERLEHRRDRLTALLQDLEYATLDLGQKVAAGMHPSVVNNARARYQAIYGTAALEFNLPVCEALSDAARMDQIVQLSQEASVEISARRKGLATGPA